MDKTLPSVSAMGMQIRGQNVVKSVMKFQKNCIFVVKIWFFVVCSNTYTRGENLCRQSFSSTTLSD